MLSYRAEEYANAMLDAYLEDETEHFNTHDFCNDFRVWMELEAAGIVNVNPERTVATLNPEAIIRDAFPDDIPY